MKPISRWLGLLPSFMLLAACAGWPGHVQAPERSDTRASALLTPGAGDWPSAQWWSSLGDTQLQDWIKRAQSQAPQMLLAAAQLDEARAGLQLAQAQKKAQVSLDSSVTRERFSANSYIPPPFGGQFYNDGELSANFHYDLDFWGRQRQALKAALGEARARSYELQGQADWIAARVVTLYLSLQVAQARLDRLQNQQRLRQQRLQLDEQRVHTGLLAEDALELQRQALLQTEQAYQEQLGQREQLWVDLQQWVGLPRQQLVLQVRPLPSLIQTMPATLQLDLLARRSDLAAALARVEAAAARAEVARTDFYPDVSLGMFAGWSSLILSRWLNQSSSTYGIAPAVHLPLFDGGRLRAHLNEEKAALLSADASYRQVLMTAITQVNSAQVRIAQAQAQRACLAQRLQELDRHALNLQQRHAAGLIDEHTLLDSAVERLDLLDADAHWNEELLLAQVALIEALGGGFKADTRPPQTTRIPHD